MDLETLGKVSYGELEPKARLAILLSNSGKVIQLKTLTEREDVMST